jgi:dTDP-4-amino-4,6-dideoxygalactose transaminase
LMLPNAPDWAEPVWHLYVVRSNARDQLQGHLAKSEIGTLIHYPIPPHKQAAFANGNYDAHAYPIASRMANKVLSLPIGPHLGHQELTEVLSTIIAFEGKHN